MSSAGLTPVFIVNRWQQCGASANSTPDIWSLLVYAPGLTQPLVARGVASQSLTSAAALAKNYGDWKNAIFWVPTAVTQMSQGKQSSRFPIRVGTPDGPAISFVGQGTGALTVEPYTGGSTTTTQTVQFNQTASTPDGILFLPERNNVGLSMGGNGNNFLNSYGNDPLCSNLAFIPIPDLCIEGSTTCTNCMTTGLGSPSIGYCATSSSPLVLRFRASSSGDASQLANDANQSTTAPVHLAGTSPLLGTPKVSTESVLLSVTLLVGLPLFTMFLIKALRK